MLRSRIKTFSCHRGWLGKGASLSRGEWVCTIIIYLVPADFMNTIRTELWIHKHPDFFSFIAPLLMCNSIVPTLYRNINPKIIFRKKTAVFIFSLASCDLMPCVLIPALYLWEVLPINLGYGLSSSHQKTMKVERPHWLYPWSRNTLSDADTTYPGHSLVIRGNWDYLYFYAFLIFSVKIYHQWCQVAVANDDVIGDSK